MTGGPAAGHSLSRPASLDTLVRSGPCHCGHSAADAAVPSTTTRLAAVKLTLMFYVLLSSAVSSVHLPATPRHGGVRNHPLPPARTASGQAPSGGLSVSGCSLLGGRGRRSSS